MFWLGILFFCLNAYGETVLWKEWRNSLRPEGKPGGELTLSEEGKTSYKIVIPKQSTCQEEKSAADLSYWLNQITGADFAVVKDSTKYSRKEINIGKTKRRAEANLAITEEELGEEGYVIAVKGEDLFLAGGSKRGPINAVYALLEEDLGCRWYAGRDSVIPHERTLKFRPIPRSYKPPFKYRDPFYYVAFDGLWSLRNRTNAHLAEIPEEWGGHIDYALFVHSTAFLLPHERYFDEHPEYFQLNADGTRNKGQMCPMNEDLPEIIAENVMVYLDENPEAEIIDISKGDGGAKCYCEKCRKINEEEETEAANFLYLVNEVARRVEKKYPKILISTLAYLETKIPPKELKPRKNVTIRVCTDRDSMWKDPFLPVRGNEDFSKALRGWKKLSEHVDIWDYSTNFAHLVAPNPNMDVIADNIRFFAECGAEGVMEQAGNECPATERDLMRAWVFSKLMWDPARDEWELMQDFIWGYFGQAAPAIAEYNALLRETASDKKKMGDPVYRNMYPMDSPFLTKDFIDEASALYDKAEILAENEEILRRVQRDRLAVMYVKLERGFNFVGGEYGALLQKFEASARREGLSFVRHNTNYFSERRFGTFPGFPGQKFIHTLDEKLDDWKKRAVKEIESLNLKETNDPVRVYKIP